MTYIYVIKTIKLVAGPSIILLTQSANLQVTHHHLNLKIFPQTLIRP